MTLHDARLAPAGAAAWLVCATITLNWSEWLMVVGALVALAALGLRSARPAVFVAIAAGVSAGVVATAVERGEAPLHAATGHVVVLEGTSATDAVRSLTRAGAADTWRIDLAVESVTVGTVPEATRARVMVWIAGDASAIVRGERVRIQGLLKPRNDASEPVVFGATLIERTPVTGVDAAMAYVRERFRASTAHLSPRSAALTRGMVIGDDSGMDRLQRDQFAAAGLTHLTAVSGAHFAIVLVTVTAVLRTVTRRRRINAVIAGLTMVAFTLAVFPEPSVVRALTMAIVICCGLWWGRPAQALPALSAGVLGVALVEPRLACEVGFAMSVAAVAAIVLWAPALAARIDRSRPRWMPAVIVRPLAICLAAQIAVAPLLALIDGVVGPWSVVANLVAGWWAAPVTIIGLVALVLGCVWTPAGVALATATSWFAWPVDAVARAVWSLPGANLSVPATVAGATVAAIVGALAIALTFATRLNLTPLVRILVAVIVIVASVPAVSRGFGERAPGDWLVVACDVGQGDAMLVRSGPARAILIDAGPRRGESEGGTGSERTATDCVHRYGVRAIDLLVITHPHADHDGGVAELLNHVTVARAWVSPAHAQAPNAATAALADHLVPVEVVVAGAQLHLPEASIVALSPASTAAAGGEEEANDASIATLVDVAGVTVLGLGDLEVDGQRGLARRAGAMIVDVVKVAHHGSASQDAGLAAQVDARLAIFSAGAGNSYGHPSDEAMDLWSASAALTARTDLCGDVVIVPGPSFVTRCPTDVAG